VIPAVSTIWRILSRRGFVRPQPQKRPRSSWRTFCADQPNERWQADITHWQLVDGTEVGILNILDDHSRLQIAGDARRTTTGLDVVASFQKAFRQWGIPAGMLTDNGAVFTAKQRGEGRVALEVELGVLGVRFDHSRPYHPQTCGQSGTVPPNPEEMVSRPACRGHRRSAATPTEPVRQLLQHPAAAPRASTRHARPGLCRQTQGHSGSQIGSHHTAIGERHPARIFG
jgi:hypothetical protein